MHSFLTTTSADARAVNDVSLLCLVSQTTSLKKQMSGNEKQTPRKKKLKSPPPNRELETKEPHHLIETSRSVNSGNDRGVSEERAHQNNKKEKKKKNV